MKLRTTAFLLAIVLAGLAGASASTANVSAASWSSALGAVVYFNDFESTAGPGWSNPKLSRTPVGNRGFLGDFGNDHVQLTLNSLPVHDSLTVTWDLFVIRSWDGNNTSYGPDVWDLSVVGGPSLLHTTFTACGYPCPWGNVQAYPQTYPGGSNLPYSAASEIETLGYMYGPDPRSAVYHITRSLSHTANSVVLDFSASGLESLDNESWGLDNVYVNLGSQPTYSISGHVSDGTNGVYMVAISGGAGLMGTTNGIGDYVLTGVPAGTYVLVPSKTGYVFNPPSLTVTVPPDAPGNDFLATIPGYSIWGRVSGDSACITDVSISDPSGYHATTDSTGTYHLSSLPGGTYTLTAKKSSCNFSVLPPITVPPNATFQNFTGFQIPVRLFLPHVFR